MLYFNTFYIFIIANNSSMIDLLTTPINRRCKGQGMQLVKQRCTPSARSVGPERQRRKEHELPLEALRLGRRPHGSHNERCRSQRRALRRKVTPQVLSHSPQTQPRQQRPKSKNKSKLNVKVTNLRMFVKLGYCCKLGTTVSLCMYYLPRTQRTSCKCCSCRS